MRFALQCYCIPRTSELSSITKVVYLNLSNVQRRIYDIYHMNTRTQVFNLMLALAVILKLFSKHKFCAAFINTPLKAYLKDFLLQHSGSTKNLAEERTYLSCYLCTYGVSALPNASETARQVRQMRCKFNSLARWSLLSPALCAIISLIRLSNVVLE